MRARVEPYNSNGCRAKFNDVKDSGPQSTEATLHSARFCLLVLILLLNFPLWAQQTQTPATSSPGQTVTTPPVAQPPGWIYSPPDLLPDAVRDPQALDVVQKAITVMGGPAVAAVQDCTIQAQSDALPGTPATSGTMTWKLAGSEFRIDAPIPNGTASVMTGHGKPGMINGAATALQSYVTEAMFVPVAIAPVLAQELANPKMSLRFKDNETLGTVSVAVVTTALETDYPDNVVTPQTWYFDTSTGLPVRVEFRAPDIHDPLNFIPTAVDLSNFQLISGVAYPFKVVSSVDSQTQVVFIVQSVVVDSGIAPSTFDGPFVSTVGAR